MKYILKILFIIAIFIQAATAQQNYEKGKVALVMSSEDSFLSIGMEKQILEQITAWEFMLMNNKINYDVLTPDEIDNSLQEEYDCVIIATNLLLQEDEWEALQEYATESGKLFIAGSIIVQDENVVLTNSEVLFRLTGIPIVSPVSKSNINLTQVITGNTQLTKDLENGSRLLLSGSSEIYYSDYGYSATKNIGYLEYPFDTLGTIANRHSSIVYGLNGKAKFVWCGFGPSDIIGGTVDQKLFVSFVNNSISWLNANPYSAIEQWQRGKNSAFILSPIINGRIDITNKFISILNDNKITADFMVEENAVRDSALLRKLSPYGNFGLYLTDLNKNKRRLLDLVNELEEITSSKIEYIGTDDVVPVIQLKQELIDAGVKVVIISNNQQSRIPYFLDDELKLLIIPATYSTIRDEKENQILKTGLISYNELYKDAINHWILDLNFCERKTESELRKYFSNLLNENGIYKIDHVVTNSIAVYDWYQKKAGIKIRIVNSDIENYEIELKNANDTSVENIVFVVADNKLSNEPILYENGKLSDQNFEYDKYENRIKIYVESISPYETKRIRVSIKAIF